MIAQKSPGGSIFPYYYKGGEIHAFKFGSFQRNEEDLISLMQAEEEFARYTNCKLRIWVDFYDTYLSTRVLVEFIKIIDRLADRIVKLSLVGMGFSGRLKFRRTLHKLRSILPMPIKFYDDPEEAKTWLVSEDITI